MANFTPTKDGGVIKWGAEDWLAGLVPNYGNSGSVPTALGIKGLSYAHATDPFRKFGCIAPGADLGVISGIPDDTPYASFYSADSSDNYPTVALTLYDSSGVATIGKITTNNDTWVASGAWPHTVTVGGRTIGPADWGVTYRIGTKDYFLFRYSYDSNAGHDVGRYDFSDPTISGFDDDYLSTVPAGAAGLDKGQGASLARPYKGSDEILYIPDGPNLHALDGQTGANGTLSKNVFQLPASFTITAVGENENFLVIFANSGRDCRAFWWDKSSLRATYQYKLPVVQVSAAFSNFQGTHGCIGFGMSNILNGGQTGKLLVFDGRKYQEVANPNVPPTSAGVEVVGNSLWWPSNIANKIFSYGAPYPGQQNSLQCPLAVTAQGVGYTNNMRNVTPASIYLSPIFYLTGTNGSNQPIIRKTNWGSYSAYCKFAVPFFTPPLPEEYRGKIKSVVINWGEVASGGHPIQVDLYTNKGASTITIVSGKTVVTADTLLQKIIADTSMKSLGANRFDSIGFGVSYSAGASTTAVPPYIQSLEVHYSLEKI